MWNQMNIIYDNVNLFLDNLNVKQGTQISHVFLSRRLVFDAGGVENLIFVMHLSYL